MTNYIERYWRDATPADAIKEPPMVARFRIDENDKWSICKLHGVDRSIAFKWRGKSYAGKECQVYDTPDPGEGWRLIDIDKETPQEGDEVWGGVGQWFSRGDCCGIFRANNHYRRRIEQPKPESKYVPFTWEDREQLRGRWIRREEDSGVTLEMPIEKLESDGCELFLINGYTAKQIIDLWRFLDTGEPVGRKVTQ